MTLPGFVWWPARGGLTADRAWRHERGTGLRDEPQRQSRGGQCPGEGGRAVRASRTAILRAAGELLLEHGLHAISMDAVAERAGASKATIYRWWPSKELLALDALFSEWAPAAGQPRHGLARRRPARAHPAHGRDSSPRSPTAG